MVAAGLNPVDLAIVSGTMPFRLLVEVVIAGFAGYGGKHRALAQGPAMRARCPAYGGSRLPLGVITRPGRRELLRGTHHLTSESGELLRKVAILNLSGLVKDLPSARDR